MPKKAKSHAQNRANVCLICFKVGSSMTKIGGITLDRVKRFYIENFDPTDAKMPNGVCAHCRKLLERIDSGKLDTNCLPDPINFSSLSFPAVTRSTGTLDRDQVTFCTCSLCKVAMQEFRGEVGSIGRKKNKSGPFLKGRPKTMEIERLPLAKPVSRCQRCLTAYRL